MKLVAVVTTYNRLNELRITLERLLAVAKDSLGAVVVVNNCSSDGTEEWLNTQQDPRLLVHHSECNLGGAGGFEVGMRLIGADVLNEIYRGSTAEQNVTIGTQNQFCV